MKIFFLGTNGWYSSELGLTPCILIDAREGYIVLDAGEGIHKLGRYITDHKKPIYIFLSHFHLDHVHGLHILAKFHFKQDVTIIGKTGTKKYLDLLISDPFSARFDQLDFNVKILEIDEGSYRKPLPFSCLILPHPDPSMGYRLESEGKIVTYCTDTGPHQNIHRLAANSDILICECGYLSGETDKNWPHMNPQTAAQAARQSNAKKLILIHFAADRYNTIAKRKNAERIAKRTLKNTMAAFDNMVIKL